MQSVAINANGVEMRCVSCARRGVHCTLIYVTAVLRLLSGMGRSIDCNLSNRLYTCYWRWYYVPLDLRRWRHLLHHSKAKPANNGGPLNTLTAGNASAGDAARFKMSVADPWDLNPMREPFECAPDCTHRRHWPSSHRRLRCHQYQRRLVRDRCDMIRPTVASSIVMLAVAIEVRACAPYFCRDIFHDTCCGLLLFCCHSEIYIFTSI